MSTRQFYFIPEGTEITGIDISNKWKHVLVTMKPWMAWKDQTRIGPEIINGQKLYIKLPNSREFSCFVVDEAAAVLVEFVSLEEDRINITIVDPKVSSAVIEQLKDVLMENMPSYLTGYR